MNKSKAKKPCPSTGPAHDGRGKGVGMSKGKRSGINKNKGNLERKNKYGI